MSEHEPRLAKRFKKDLSNADTGAVTLIENLLKLSDSISDNFNDLVDALQPIIVHVQPTQEQADNMVCKTDSSKMVDSLNELLYILNNLNERISYVRHHLEL